MYCTVRQNDSIIVHESIDATYKDMCCLFVKHYSTVIASIVTHAWIDQ